MVCGYDTCALGWGATAPQAMVVANKATGHHGVPETNPNLDAYNQSLCKSNKPAGTAGYPAQPGLIYQSVRQSVSPSVCQSIHLSVCACLQIRYLVEKGTSLKKDGGSSSENPK